MAGMTKFIIRRILVSIPVLFMTLLVTFTLVRLLPGGPFDNVGNKQLPAELKAAWEARYGLDKPLFLNLPNDGVPPDVGMEYRQPYNKLPNCDKLQQGIAPAQATDPDAVVVSNGWYLLHTVEEHVSTTIRVKQGDTERSVPCDSVRTVLYSDLTRSQFFEYINNALRLDFGLSLGRTTRGIPVLDIIADRIPVSAQLGILSVIVGFLFGIPLGVVAAIYHNSVIDFSATLLAVALASIPTFVLGPILILIFVNQLHWFPSPDPRVWINPDWLSWNYVGRVILPLFTLGTGVSAGLARLTRASLLQVMQDDYIRTARAKGLRERGVIYIHALKNALIPVATIFGPLLAGVVLGSFFVENIFAIPGLGDSFISSVAERDYNLLTGEAILYSSFLILGNILVDVMYTWLDPRIRFD
jgi:ABC-type dipeptide/oligopeptide/nickel transport system permease component